jgi:hypothetical protein
MPPNRDLSSILAKLPEVHRRYSSLLTRRWSKEDSNRRSLSDNLF